MMVRAALAVIALVVLGVGTYLVLDAFTVGSVTFRFVDEVVAQRAQLQGRHVKVAGSFVGGSRAPAGPGKISFAIEKGNARLTVVADESLPPGGFDVAGRDIVVDGTLDPAGIFHATLVTTGCPSRYEAKRR
jgi:cytochrome c-type biogenesis protein CcmE